MKIFGASSSGTTTQLQQILTTINQVDIFKFITKPWKLEEEFKRVIYQALDYYLMIDENQKNKAALEKQNQEYQNIIKQMDVSVALAKGKTALLADYMKAVFRYHKEAGGEIHPAVFVYEERIGTIIVDALCGERQSIA